MYFITEVPNNLTERSHIVYALYAYWTDDIQINRVSYELGEIKVNIYLVSAYLGKLCDYFFSQLHANYFMDVTSVRNVNKNNMKKKK